ncbi:hypothetical protein BDZ90DRAFT_157596 [Jaminaea rosea]|uniref:Uncharacterized protein n=1 Tax=Jaminaea rosea TaxID=1569628 RepID=A0A316USH5_9BASI|nr:hypothetical protein BDZ90DRAFT_157596 [Jaminaea rosea]PWN27944.1 hypothetical protein BDZ90DRAFT_157596 [Jaminaea rosea]
MPGPHGLRYVPQLKRDQVEFPYTPSEPLDLSRIPWDDGQVRQEPLAVPETVQRRNDDLLAELQAHVHEEYEEDEDVVRAMRWRSAVWAGQPAEGGHDEEPKTSCDNGLPKAFRFHHHQDSMKLHWKRAIKSEENALVRPTPCHLFRTPRPRPRPTPSRRSPSPLLEQVAPSSSSSAALPQAEQQGDPPALLTISVYSRPLLKPDRKGLLRTIAARGWEERGHHDVPESLPANKSASSKKKRRTQSSAQSDEQGEGEEEEQDEEPTGPISHRSTSLFHSHFGPASAADEQDDQSRPSQIIQLYSSQTLQELRDAVVCRMDDLPEREEGDDVRFTGRKRSGECAMMIEGLVVAEHEESWMVEAMLKADPSRKAAKETMTTQRLDHLGVPIRLHTPYWLGHQDGLCEHFWVIDEVRKPTVDDPAPPLPTSYPSPATVHKHATASAAASTAAPPYRTPISTYLSTSALSRPLPLWANPIAGEHQYGMGYCNLCERDAATVAVVGGAGPPAVENVEEDEENEATGPRKAGLPSLPGHVTVLCRRCALLWSGVSPRTVVTQRSQTVTTNGDPASSEASTSNANGAQAGSSNGHRAKQQATIARRGRGKARGRGSTRVGQRGKPAEPQTAERGAAEQPDSASSTPSDDDASASLQPQPAKSSASTSTTRKVVPSLSSAAKAQLNADVSEDKGWRAMREEVDAQDGDEGGKGGGGADPWTIVPLLD